MTLDTTTAELAEWSTYSGAVDWQALLIGNGASRAVWDRFKYPSLYDVAREADITDKLSVEDQLLFQKLGDTRNFEAVLGALLTADSVCEALDLSPRVRIADRYGSIQKALVAAVHHVHVPWQAVPQESLLKIREALLEYEFVFSTNYDLLIYWAIMAERPSRFTDYFFGPAFDIANSDVSRKITRVLYLHGALHLYYGRDGVTYKERAAEFVNLLDLFGKRPETVPLCITEGTARQKLAAIARSDYLSFALQQLGRSRGPLVIVGQGLGETDAHIADIIARVPARTVAVGIYPFDDVQTIKEKAHFRQQLPSATLMFFDSRTHPLGDPTLRIE